MLTVKVIDDNDLGAFLECTTAFLDDALYLLAAAAAATVALIIRRRRRRARHEAASCESATEADDARC